MNTAPAELLHFLTIAALQPSTSAPPALPDRRRHPNLGAMVVVVGRVLSSWTPHRDRYPVFIFKEKTAQPELNQARRSSKNGAVLCISV
jgi:hypothetical protein